MGRLVEAARRFQDDVLGVLVDEDEKWPEETARALREVCSDIVLLMQRIGG